MKLGDADWRADPKVLAHFGDVLDATELRRMRGATSSIWPFFGSRLFEIENERFALNFILQCAGLVDDSRLSGYDSIL